jgi:hypothetical protein
MKQKKLAAKKRGGARLGSGPKPKPPDQLKVAYSTRLAPEVVACIRKQENQVAFIELASRSRKNFGGGKAAKTGHCNSVWRGVTIFTGGKMMEAIMKLLAAFGNSKKAWATFIGLIMMFVGQQIGMSEQQIQETTALVIAYVIGQGIADHGKEAAKAQHDASRRLLACGQCVAIPAGVVGLVFLLRNGWHLMENLIPIIAGLAGTVLVASAVPWRSMLAKFKPSQPTEANRSRCRRSATRGQSRLGARYHAGMWGSIC